MADDYDEERITSCIRGYHVYKTVWQARIGERLHCIRETSNTVDRYAVCVVKRGEIIGHLPKKIARACSLFLRRGGQVTAVVTGEKRYSRDLPQGGLEVPCELIMKRKKKELEKLLSLM